MGNNDHNAAIVAAVQFDPKHLDPRTNIATVQQLAFEAAGKGARVIVMPELCTTGMNLANTREAADVAQTRTGWQTSAITEVAKQMNCQIIFGYVELSEGKLYNSAAIVGPNGLEASAQKHNLHGPDNMWAQPSEQVPPVVLTPAGRLGVLICRDAMNHYRESYAFYRPGQKFYAPGNIDTIALLTNWGGSYAYPDSAWIELVESTKANVIVSNRVGNELDLSFKGGSCIIDRDRRIWTHGSSFNEAAVVGGVAIV